MLTLVYNSDKSKLTCGPVHAEVRQGAARIGVVNVSSCGDSVQRFIASREREVELTIAGRAPLEWVGVRALLVAVFGDAYNTVEGAVVRVTGDGAKSTVTFSGVEPIAPELVELHRFEARLKSVEDSIAAIQVGLKSAFRIENDYDRDDWDD